MGRSDVLTWLYVPGDRPDRFAKAIASGTDVVILDLEDAVAPDRKCYARDAVAEFLSDRPAVPCQVRVNDLADLPAVVGLPGLDSLRLPKVDDPAQLVEYARRAPGVPLHPLIETALGVERAYDIAGAHPAVASVELGEADLSSDLGITDESGLSWARGRMVIAARAAGLPAPAMSVWAHLSDDEGLAASCALGRSMGMVGRAAIHPRQVPVIGAAFRPTAAEVDHAWSVLTAFQAASREHAGIVVLPDGTFVDRAMVGAAERVVALAEQ